MCVVAFGGFAPPEHNASILQTDPLDYSGKTPFLTVMSSLRLIAVLRRLTVRAGSAGFEPAMAIHHRWFQSIRLQPLDQPP